MAELSARRSLGWAKNGVVDCLILGFLLFNLVIRFGSIFNYPPYNGAIAGFLGAVVAACVFAVFRPSYLKHLLFIFGFSFFLFGFGSIDIQSRIFELLVTLVATTLFVINWRAGSREQGAGSKEGGEQKAEKSEGEKIRRLAMLNRPLVTLILCYVTLSLFSLLLLPVTQIFRDFWFFGFPDFFFYLFIGPPHSFYYSVAAVIRLMLFAVLAVELSRCVNSDKLFKWLFFGIFLGAVLSAIIGLMDFYGLISVVWYRMGKTELPGVLHSTFLNSGWFAEFILVSVPFVLIGMQAARTYFVKILLITTLILCEIALILCAARAGWVSYPLILVFCWVFFYLSREGRLESFHFKWRDVVKIAVSVPLTIVISLVLVFYLLMPLLDSVRERDNFKGIAKDRKSTTEFIKQEASTVFSPYSSSRPMRWRQGFNIGMESPLFGVGYESYARHALILSDLPSSGYAKVKGSNAQTSHGTIFQLFVNGGIVGVSLWLLMMGYGLIVLIVDLIKNKRLLNIPVAISIIAFHAYGIFQSMQYIPMIWSMIFLCLGYAMTIDDRVLPGRLRKAFGVLTKASVVLVGIGLFVYLGNFESKDLAQKYDMRVYAMEEDRDCFAGFHQHSQRWKYGDYRWCGRRGAIYVPEAGARNAERAPVERPGRGPGSTGQGREGVVELEFYCMTPGREEEPVVVTVSHEGEVLDKIAFGARSEEQGARGKGGSAKLKGKSSKIRGVSVKRRYELRGEQGKGQRSEIGGQMPAEERGQKEQRLDIEVSRTWIPHNHLGNFDRRELGIGVKMR